MTTGQYPRARTTGTEEEFERQAEVARGLLREEASALRAVNPKLNDYFAKSWEMVAELGVAYPPRPLPEGYEFGEPDMCIANAIRCSVDYGLTYVEGVTYQPGEDGEAFEGGRPVPNGLQRHAFCVDHEGLIVETTYGYIGERGVYLGYPLSVGLARGFSPTESVLSPLTVYAALGSRIYTDALQIIDLFDSNATGGQQT